MQIHYTTNLSNYCFDFSKLYGYRRAGDLHFEDTEFRGFHGFYRTSIILLYPRNRKIAGQSSPTT